MSLYSNFPNHCRVRCRDLSQNKESRPDIPAAQEGKYAIYALFYPAYEIAADESLCSFLEYHSVIILFNIHTEGVCDHWELCLKDNTTTAVRARGYRCKSQISDCKSTGSQLSEGSV